MVEGNLELIDTVLFPHEGFLKVGGNYSMCGSSSLLMIHTADRLQIEGNFKTWSTVDHTNLLQRGRMGLYGNFYQYGNPYSFNSEKDLLVAFMGDYTHYYWFSNRFSSRFTVTYGKAEELDAPYEIDENLANAVIYGIRAGLIEMADSPDEVLAAAAIGAAAGLGIALVSTAAPGVAVFAGVIGIGVTIVEFYEDFKYICSIDGSYEQIRETAKLATVFAVTSLAAGIGTKVGGAAGSASSGKVHEVSAAVEKEIQNQKIWKNTCDWMKKNVLENAKAFTDDVKKLLDEAVVSRVKGWLDNSKAQILYKYQNLKGDDIYAELKNLMDEDAFDYLQKEFYYHNVDAYPNKLKLLEDTADCIKAAQEALGKKLNRDEVTYINEEWGRRMPGSAKTKQQLKESIVNYIQYGKIYVKRRLKSRCESIRAAMPNSKTRNQGNIAVAEVDILGLKSEFIAHSKIQLPSDKGADMFDFSFLKPQTEQIFNSYLSMGKYVRTVDSEAKILEDVAAQIRNRNIQGMIDLYTEKTCCPSCKNIIQEFQERFPNIILNVYDS